MIWAEILESLVTSAVVSFFFVNTLSVLMAIVEVRELTFVNKRLALMSRHVWKNILESLTTSTSVSLLLVDTFGTRVTIVELREQTLIDDSTGVGGRIATVVDGTSALGLSIDESANFVQLNLARSAIVNSALIWGWSWSRNTESTWMSDSVWRLIKEL